MTKPLLPWSLKGVSLDARKRAKDAAGSEGVPLGKWLSETIREVAAAETEKPAPTPAAAVEASSPSATDPVMVDHDTLTPEPPADAPADDAPVAPGPDVVPAPVADAPIEPSAPTLDEPAPQAAAAEPERAPPPDWQAAVADLAQRVDETDRKVAAAVDRVLARLDEIDARGTRRGFKLNLDFRPWRGRRPSDRG
jgi:hypothetical protein